MSEQSKTSCVPDWNIQFSGNNAHNICLFSGKDKSGRDAWYFLQIYPDRLEEFSKKYNEAIDLAEYGEVLYSGYGKSPPSEIQALMQNKYGFL